MMKKRYKGAISYRTDIGRVRINNEDQAAAAINSQGEVLLCVCDGMGGQNKGDYASKMAIDYVIDTFKEKDGKGFSFLKKRFLAKMVRSANSLIFNEADKNPTYKDMGTTLVLAFISGEKLILINIGDSRAYMLKDDRIVRLSEDQTYVDYLYRTGKISRDETMSHPDRHVLMNALGIYPSLSMDVKVFPYHGEPVLLCSDGLYNNVAESEIAAVMASDERPDQKVGALINEANLNGGSDNIAISYWEAFHD
jgi:protein phosphatase